MVGAPLTTRSARLRRRRHRAGLRRAGGGRPAGPGARRHPPRLPPVDTCAGEFPAETPYFYSLARDRRGRAAGRAAQRDRGRLRADPDRAGHRVRLLLGARRMGDPRDGPRRGRHQQQPRDRLHRLRRLHAPLLRAARRRERAGRHRPRAGPDRRAAARGPHLRRPDGDRPGQGAGLRRCADRRADRPGDRADRGSGAIRAAARRARDRGTARPAGRGRGGAPQVDRRARACRSSSARRG